MGHSAHRRHRASRPSRSRVRSSVRHLVVLLLGVVLVLGTGPVPSAQATPGRDDYPRSLKRVVQDGVADPWLFWNRECTSFVAWRLNNDRDVQFHNYYLGVHWGDASNWAYAARRTGIQVNDAATRGAVAWWPRNSPGSTPGHVAFVLGSGAGWVKIEEYNYATRGGYGVRTLFKGTSAYPEGFIHLRPIRFRATERPSIEGTTRVGEVLVADRGTWWPSTVTPDISYAWFADGRRIRGADRRRLRVPGEHVGARITVKAVARRDDVRPGAALSRPLGKVRRGTLTLRRDPAVRGTAEVGVPLTAVTGATRPAAVPAVQWLVDGRAVPGATGETFTPRPEDLGLTVTAKVRQELTGYRRLAATTEPGARVAPGTLRLTSPPTLPDDPRVGLRIKVEPGGWPSGTDLAYQWFADGSPVGVGRRGFTPGVEELGRRLTVKVTATKPGYRDASETTAASAPVALGTLVTTAAPAVTGTPKVASTLTLEPGRWSKTPDLALQWLTDGAVVPGATDSTFTPGPEHVHSRISVRLTATLPGYRDVVAYATALSATARGDVTRTRRPVVTGTPWTGETLTSSQAQWSVEPGSTRYRWLADGLPVAGATGPTLTLTPELVGRKLVVQQRMTAPGYRPITASSRPVVPRHGQVTWSVEPTVQGRSVAGRTLTVETGATVPERGVKTAVAWLRDGKKIRRATGTTYVLTPDDVGSRISARVRATRTDWARGEVVVPVRPAVRAASRLVADVDVDRRRATLVVKVRTPGRAPSGTLTVLLDGTRTATRSVSGGEARTVRLGRLSPGKHRVAVRFAGKGATKTSTAVRFRIAR